MYASSSLKNPLTEARSVANISANRLAKSLKLSRQYLSRADQGTYININPSLMAFTCETLHTNSKDVMESYRKFQEARRLETIERINPRLLAVEPPVDGSKSKFHYEIFRGWREEYWNTIITFASQMCVHPGTVTNYETGQQRHMPYMIRDALVQVKLLHPSFDTEAR